MSVSVKDASELKEDELFSVRVRAESRTYFLTVKTATNGSRYLVATETRIVRGEKKKGEVFVFAEHLPAFTEALNLVNGFLEGHTAAEPETTEDLFF